jgi:hypothetical protein
MPDEVTSLVNRDSSWRDGVLVDLQFIIIVGLFGGMIEAEASTFTLTELTP